MRRSWGTGITGGDSRPRRLPWGSHLSPGEPPSLSRCRGGFSFAFWGGGCCCFLLRCHRGAHCPFVLCWLLNALQAPGLDASMFALSASSVGFFFSRLLSRSERFKPGLEHFLINNCVALCSLDVFAKNIGAFSCFSDSFAVGCGWGKTSWR